MVVVFTCDWGERVGTENTTTVCRLANAKPEMLKAVLPTTLVSLLVTVATKAFPAGALTAALSVTVAETPTPAFVAVGDSVIVSPSGTSDTEPEGLAPFADT